MSKGSSGVRALVAWTAPACADGTGPPTLYVDGEALAEAPRGRRWRSVVAYHVGAMDHALLEGWIEEEDSARASRDGKDRSYTYRSAGHTFRLLGADAWGLPGEAEAAAEALSELRAALADEGWKWGLTASTIAGRVMAEEKLRPGQLPPRWRALAHDAIHQGPVAVLRGGAPVAVASDRTAAFLAGLRTPVGLTWTAGLRRWEHVRRQVGIAFATVRVAPCDLPPLPIRKGGGTLYPSGHFAGTWTIQQLRDAEDAGSVEVEQLHEAAVAIDPAPYYAGCADRIEAIADKNLRKLVYTRFWGRLARLGGFEGTRERPEDTSSDRWIGSSLWWTWRGHGGDSFECPPDYRPDHAAAIAGTNSTAMQRAVRRVPPGQLVAAHVDCLWTAGAEPPAFEGAWKRKRTDAQGGTVAPLRCYAPGVYVHGETLAASGLRTLPKSAAEVEAWATSGPGAGWARKAREWREGVTCVDSAEAVSDPPGHHDEEGRRVRYDLDGPRWTARGWRPREEAGTLDDGGSEHEPT